MNTRRDFVRSLSGLGAIIATGQAPAAIVRSMVAVRGTMMGKTGWKNPYVTDGLIAMWDGMWNTGGGRHDDNATTWVDLSGNGWDATISGSPSGHWNDNSFINDYSPVYLQTGFKIPAGNFTAEASCLFNNTGLSNAYANTVFSSRIEQVASTAGFHLRHYNGSYGFVYPNSSTSTAILGSSVYGFSFSFVNNGPNNSFYKDGILSASSSDGFTNNQVVLNNSLYFCVQRNAQYQYFKGSIYSIRYYSRPLSAAEIDANHAVDVARFNLPAA